MKRWWIVGLLALAGCAHMHIDCPQAGSVVVAVGGSQIGSQVVSGIQTGIATGALPLLAPKATATTAGASVDYNYLAVWGPDYARCDVIPPPQPVPIPLPVTMVPSK